MTEHHYNLGWLRWFMPAVALVVAGVHLLAIGGLALVMLVSGASLKTLLLASVCMLPWLTAVVWFLVGFLWRLPLALYFDKDKLYWQTAMRSYEVPLSEVQRIGARGRLRVGVVIELSNKRPLKLVVLHGLGEWADALGRTRPGLEVDLGAASKQLERLGSRTQSSAYSATQRQDPQFES